MPQTPIEAPATCRTHADRTATTVVEYRVPDPHSACGETSEPFPLLVCDLPDCLDLAEDEAVYRGATEALIDTWSLSSAELAYFAGQDAA